MNGTTLRALRAGLGYTQQEAAQLIGAVLLRTWQYWESGDRTIPADVEAAVRELVRWKLAAIAAGTAQIEQMLAAYDDPPESLIMPYHTNLDSWMMQLDAQPTHWRPHTMALAALAERYPFIRLVAFDPDAHDLLHRGVLGTITQRSTP